MKCVLSGLRSLVGLISGSENAFPVLEVTFLSIKTKQNFTLPHETQIKGNINTVKKWVFLTTTTKKKKPYKVPKAICKKWYILDKVL